jgi:hypothetical protein
VEFTIRAFIPISLSGYTRTVPSGPHAGESVIPHPGRPVLDFYYLTDQRGFSSAPGVSARMTSTLHLDLSGANPTMTQSHDVGTTVELSGSSWTETCNSTASTDRMSFSDLQHIGDLVTVEVNGAAANPCSQLAQYIGDIDYTGTLVIDQASGSVSFQGMVDKFPWFEAYVVINHGRTETLFTQESAAGATVRSLVGYPSVAVSGVASVPTVPGPGLAVAGRKK